MAYVFSTKAVAFLKLATIVIIKRGFSNSSMISKANKQTNKQTNKHKTKMGYANLTLHKHLNFCKRFLKTSWCLS